ncbi:unnamed protein product [Staurois parvus]|uniref:Uncharacterized protein n=1 Tax=Staurois parvus TaxID=386267 RepID=A0ABN9FM56_9NEOB|nr:unnamed protein product [Staurois parvus]
MRRCSGIPRSLTLSCAPAMSLLQCPRQCPLAMSSGGCRHLSSGFRPLRALGRTGTERREI